MNDLLVLMMILVVCLSGCLLIKASKFSPKNKISASQHYTIMRAEIWHSLFENNHNNIGFILDKTRIRFDRLGGSLINIERSLDVSYTKAH